MRLTQLLSLSVGLFWSPVACHAFVGDAQVLSSHGWKRPSSTRRYVSELHVPGYAQTKLPFILENPPPTLYPLSYSSSDYDSIIPYQDGHLLHKTNGADSVAFVGAKDGSIIPYQDGHLLHKTNGAVFSADECNRIVQEAEDVAAKMDWTRNRHGNFPTTDLPLVELPQTLEFLKTALVQRIYPLLTAQFGQFLPDAAKLRVADGFIVKYDAAGGQTELKPHRDGSVLSFNIALNPASEFEGGGTWFHSLNDAVKNDQGEMVSHASALLHGGHGITQGKRYILVAFVIVEGYDSWSMRFYNQVRNL